MSVPRRSRRLREVQDSTDEEPDSSDNASSDSDPEDFIPTFAGLTTYQLRHGQGRADFPNHTKTNIFIDAINNGYSGKHLPSPNQLVRLCFDIGVPLDQGFRVTKACVAKVVSWISNNVTQLATSGLILQTCTGKVGKKEQWDMHVAEVLIRAVHNRAFSFETSIQGGELLQQHMRRGQTYSKVQKMVAIGPTVLIKSAVSQLAPHITRAAPVRTATRRRQEQPSRPGQALSQQYSIPQYSIPQYSQPVTPQHPISQYSQPVTPQQGQGHRSGPYRPNHSTWPSGASTGLHHSAGQHSSAYTDQTSSPTPIPFYQAASTGLHHLAEQHSSAYTNQTPSPTPGRFHQAASTGLHHSAEQHSSAYTNQTSSPTSGRFHQAASTGLHHSVEQHSSAYTNQTSSPTPGRFHQAASTVQPAAPQRNYTSYCGYPSPTTPRYGHTPQYASLPPRTPQYITPTRAEEDQEEMRLRMRLAEWGFAEESVHSIIQKKRAGELGPPSSAQNSADHAAAPVKVEPEAVEVPRSAAPTWPPQFNAYASDYHYSNPAHRVTALHATGPSPPHVFQSGPLASTTPAPQMAHRMPAAYKQVQPSGQADGSATAQVATAPEIHARPTTPRVQAPPPAAHTQAPPTTPQVQAPPTAPHIQAPPTAPHTQAPLTATYAPSTATHTRALPSAQVVGLAPDSGLQPALTPTVRAAAESSETSHAAVAALQAAGAGPMHTSQQRAADAFPGTRTTSGTTADQHTASASNFLPPPSTTPQDQIRTPPAKYTAVTTQSTVYGSQHGQAAYDPSLAIVASASHYQSSTAAPAVAYDQQSLHPPPGVAGPPPPPPPPQHTFQDPPAFYGFQPRHTAYGPSLAIMSSSSHHQSPTAAPAVACDQALSQPPPGVVGPPPPPQQHKFQDPRSPVMTMARAPADTRAADFEEL